MATNSFSSHFSLRGAHRQWPGYLTVFILVLLSTSLAQASTFTVWGSHSRTLTRSGYDYIYVSSPNSITLTTHVSGSSKFTARSGAVLPDSTGDTVAVIWVDFSTTANDTSYAAVTITDGTNTDTVRYMAYDVNYATPPGGDFSLSRHQLTMLNIGDSATASIRVQNIGSAQDTIFFSIVGDSAFKIADQNVGRLSDIGLILQGQMAFDLPLAFYRTGGRTAHALLVAHCDYPYSQTDTVYLTGIDSSLGITQVRIETSAGSFGKVHVGDSLCRTYTIHNAGSTPVTVTSLTIANSMYTAHNYPQLPFTLSGNSSRSFDICFIPIMYGVSGIGSVSVRYVDTSGRHGSDFQYLYAWTDQCIETASDSIYFDQVMVGGYAEAFDQITNHSLITTMSYRKLNIDIDSMAGYSVENAFPATVSSGGSMLVTFRFQPRQVGNYGQHYEFYTDTSCYGDVTLVGHAVVDGTDSLAIFSNQTELLTLRTDSSVTSRTFTFTNNAPGTVRVTGVSLAQGTHFSITGITPHDVPDTLAHGASIAVTIQFAGDTTGFYHDSLLVTTADGLTSHIFNLEAVRGPKPVSSVRGSSPSVAVAELTISPNPAAPGPVAIATTGAKRVTVEIYDLLGTRVAELSNSLNYNWVPGSSIGSGIYIVRASGTDENGSPFTISRRLVLER